MKNKLKIKKTIFCCLVIAFCWFSNASAQEIKSTTNESEYKKENDFLRSEINYLREKIDKLNDSSAKSSDISRIELQLNDFVRRNEFDFIIKIAWATTLLALLVFVWLTGHALFRTKNSFVPPPPSEILNIMPMPTLAPPSDPQPEPPSSDSWTPPHNTPH